MDTEIQRTEDIRKIKHNFSEINKIMTKQAEMQADMLRMLNSIVQNFHLLGKALCMEQLKDHLELKRSMDLKFKFVGSKKSEVSNDK